MEPLTHDSAPELDTDAAPDPGLADATATLERVIGETGGPAAEPAPAPSAPPSPPTPGRWEKHGEFQTQAQRSHRLRQEERARQLREYGEREARWQAQMERQTQLNQQLLEHLRSLNPEKAAEIPDPLDPGFGAWLTKQIEEKNAAALKPVLDHFQTVQQREQQQAEQAQQAEYVEMVRKDIESGFRKEIAEYPFAHGVEDRVRTWVALRADRLALARYPREHAFETALREIYERSEDFRRQGLNGVAGVDRLICAELEALGLDPVDPGEDVEGASPSPAPAPNGNGHGRHPRVLQPTETERLAAVQARNRGAGPGAPRVPARTQPEVSELDEADRAGVQDHKQLMAAALRDHGGNMGKAAEAIRNLAHKRTLEGR